MATKRFVARHRATTLDSSSLYEAVGNAKALVMKAKGPGEVSQVFDTNNQVVVAVWTDDGNGPELHKLKTWPQMTADKEWEKIKADLIQPY